MKHCSNDNNHINAIYSTVYHQSIHSYILTLMKNASTVELSSRLAACRTEIGVFTDRQKDFANNYKREISFIDFEFDLSHREAIYYNAP